MAIAKQVERLLDPRYWQFRSQRRVQNIPDRERKADRIAARLPSLNASADDMVKARTLDAEGYVMLDRVVQPAWLPGLVAYFKENVCSDPYRPQLGEFIAPANAPSETHVANFSNEVVARAPHAFEIANNPSVLGTVAAALGAKPTIAQMTAWWSLPAADGGAEHAEKFHRDVDDYRFIKLFCYLTDVDEAAGPHMFVRGSHKINKLTEIGRRVPDDEVAATFGAENLIRFTGPAGTCFLENTYGIHRGIPPSKTPRLIFQVLYALQPLIYGPRRPLYDLVPKGAPADIDPYINRVYVKG